MMTFEARESQPLIFLLMILLAVFFFTIQIDPYIQPRQRKTMLVIILLIFSLVIRDYTAFLMDNRGVSPLMRTLVAIYGYVVRPVILVLLGSIVTKEWKNRILWTLPVINAAIYLTALFSGICFQIDSMNQFHRGPLGYSCHIISGILLFYLAYLTIREYGNENKTEIWIPLFNVFIILISVIMDSMVDYRFYPVSFLTIAVVGSNVFYYIWLHLQFVREHERYMQAGQRIRIMMSQIQPHFLYNTLMTIQALCRTNPEKAFYVTGIFGSYLRQNLESLDQPDLIPARKELEHTKIYAEIEMIRFSNIQVSYEIEDIDFFLPALTIQPLVENAIRHGVRVRKKGLVTISTRRNTIFHEIVIEDNGKGFNVEKIDFLEQNHIGIRNVRERIEKMCGGTVKINSVIGEGTRVVIQIPVMKKL